jgi:four helix bundle protein
LRKRYIIKTKRIGDFVSENKLVDLSFEFAIVIVKLVDEIKMPKSSYMTDQLARAGTSVGANIHEAQYAQSKRDFISKLEIALKECNESDYWLELLHETNSIDSEDFESLRRRCITLRRMLVSSVTTLKQKH